MNKNWLIGIVVVVALGALAYLGTNTDLFKGSLGGGEKGGLPAVPKARCEIFKKIYDQKGYSALMQLIKGNWNYVTVCQDKYPNLWFGYASPESCNQLKQWVNETKLTPNGGSVAEAQECMNKYPNLWYGFASKESCTKIKQWLDEGKITSGAYSDEQNECAKKYPSLWTKNPPIQKGGLPKVTKARCEEMKKWNSQGVLNQKLRGDYSYVSACIGTYPEIWLDGVTPASCYSLKKWGEQNDLSANAKTAQLSQHCVRKYPILWYGADVNEEGWSCEAIKKWEKEGVLSYLAPAYISMAQECAKNGTWYNLK